ncbi:MAG: cysteine peptidase family C39 domain-containing protein, partial [Planctomycetota bacterium]|nr:cysteine peptidase family C39 domain-containing protein [Planctomycetota bacterium]
EINNRINQELSTYLKNPSKLELTERLQQMKLDAIPFNVRYKLSNEYTMVSNVIVRFDGNRFYWQIDVSSRVDSIRPGPELAGNFFTEEFNLGWNQRRVFAWDNQKYTTYFRPGNHAIVMSMPSGINGPLTAGVIPWGYGRYSYVSLSGAQLSAVEVESDGQSEIHLTVVNGDNQETFILDPSNGYAVKFYSAIAGNTSMRVANYSDYKSINGNWCPGNIITEQYDITANPAKIVARDIWDFISISNDVPEPRSFEVDYDYDAFIEDYRFGLKPLQYRYLPPQELSVRKIDIEELLQKRLEIAYLPESANQNCATVCLKYVCEKLGFNPSWKDLSQLVHGGEKRTTLFEMKEFVRNLGLNSFAVKIDLETLKTLRDSYAILHLPEVNHYVVLGNIDDEYARLIDLDKNNFYYRDSIEHFDSIWDGTALVIANKSFAMKGNFARIGNSQLCEIIGAAQCQQCNTKIQTADDFPCKYVGGDCSTHIITYTRYGCGPASSGSCSETNMIRSVTEPCIIDPNDPNGASCIGYGEWTSSSTISACG